MRAVVDTNILVSGLLWPGNPAGLLDAILDNPIDLCLSEELLTELADVLGRAKLARQVALRGLDAEWSCRFLRERSSIIASVGSLHVAELRDPKDAHVLACAVSAEADAIVTGDMDCWRWARFKGFPSLTPSRP